MSEQKRDLRVSELRGDRERRRELMMESTAEDSPFGASPSQDQRRNWAIVLAALGLGLAVPLGYIAISVFGALSSTGAGVALMIALIVVSFAALFIGAFAFVQSRSKAFPILLAKEVMNSDLVTCGYLDSVEECASLMYRANVGAILVLDQNANVVGIATDRDLVCGALANGLDSKSTPVTQVMERNLFAVAPTDPVEKVLGFMMREGVRRVPVLEGSYGVGMISIDDLILKNACHIDDLRRVLASQMKEPGPGRGIDVGRTTAA